MPTVGRVDTKTRQAEDSRLSASLTGKHVDMSSAIDQQERVVSHRVFNPCHSIFKISKNERAHSQTVYCKAETCEVRDRGECLCRASLGGRCPYGRVSVSTGPTQRARSFTKWIKEAESQNPNVGFLKSPSEVMAAVGNYVFLPYAHMTMCEKVPFVSHSGFLLSGTPLLPKERWTVENVEALIDFRPVAMMGGVISSYQKESVPLFLLHLREFDSEMWQKLIERRPQLDVAPDHVGRKALLKTLVSPLEFSTKHEKYPVKWIWDGAQLTTTSPHAYDKTWGRLKAESVSVSVIPSDDAEVIVQDNSWVTSETVFTS